MDKLDDAVERLKRIQKREAEKAKAAGQPSNITPIKRRVIESSVLIRGRLPEELLYQHTLFCQTGIVKLNVISEVGRLRGHERHQESLCGLPLSGGDH